MAEQFQTLLPSLTGNLIPGPQIWLTKKATTVEILNRLQQLLSQEQIEMVKKEYRMILYQIIYNCQTNSLKQFWIFYFPTSITANKPHHRINKCVCSSYWKDRSVKLTIIAGLRFNWEAKFLLALKEYCFPLLFRCHNFALETHEIRTNFII